MSIFFIFPPTMKTILLACFLLNPIEINLRSFISGLKNDQGLGKCKSLLSLNVKGTKVTPKGARLAMQNLPKLQFFNCHHTLHVAAQMFKDDRDSSQKLSGTEVCQLPLMDLRFGQNNFPYKKGDLESAIALCPSVVHVKICTGWDDTFTDEELKPLLNLKNLQHLSLDNAEDNANRLSFKGGLLPILEKFGPSTLEKLQLEGLTDVNISAIAKCCSNLRSLTLHFNCQYISPSRPLQAQDNRLGRLERLKMIQYDIEESNIWIGPPSLPTAADLLILLSSPALVTLNLSPWDGRLTDQVMEEAALLYGFPNLRELEMGYSCNVGISERSIECLLTLDNPLKKISIRRGEVIKHHHVLKWESQAKKNNWDLSIIMNS